MIDETKPDIVCDTYRVFRCLKDALDYRRVNGVGGWIWVSDHDKAATLFPAHMPPSQICTHRMIKGEVGELIGQSPKGTTP